MTLSERPESQSSTLGHVLYATNTKILVSEQTWMGLVQSIAEGDQLAFHAFYARTKGLVFTWLMRIARSRQTAEMLTLDVFHDVWRRASTYDAESGSVVGWIMNLARSTPFLGLEQQTMVFLSRDAVGPPLMDVLQPSTWLWHSLARRIAAETGQTPLMPLPEGRTEPEWIEVAPGIAAKLLATDTERNRVSMLVRLAPGVAYPPHTHAGVEELYLLDGELMIEERRLYPGAYNRGKPGDSDQFVWSGTGCMCVLLTSTRDVLREMPPTDPVRREHFRAFFKGLRIQAYCLDCLSAMYEEPLPTVWRCLSENGIIGRYDECANCDKLCQTFGPSPSS